MASGRGRRPTGPGRTLWRVAVAVLALPLLGTLGRAQQQPATVLPAPAPAPAVLPAADPAAAAVDRKRQTQAELDQLAREIKTTEEREAQLRLEIEALERDRARLSERLVETTGRIRGFETSLSETEQRIGSIEGDAARIRRSLADRRAVLGDVLAALQRIGRKPPPALLVRPEDALASVRSAILIGALLPELRREAETLVADLETLEGLKRRSAMERDRFRADLVSLAEERSRVEILLEERRRAKSDQQRRLDEERRRATDLANRAGSMKDLIVRLETEIEGARKAAEAARRADEEARNRPPPKDQKSVTAALGDPTRMQPAVPFAEARGRLPMPAAGPQIKGFGDDDGLGGTMKGIQIATRPEARVASPSDGWVMYAGAFRSYGKLLIINAGGGYHVVLAGMDRVDVEIGQFVLAGEPVGSMGSKRIASAAIGLGSAGSLTAVSAGPDAQLGLPVLYVEFRKENSPIDPAPWWGHSRDEKVRG